MKKYAVRNLVALMALVTLTACGGGGSDSGTGGTPGGTAEGAYAGTLTGSTSNAFQMVVLDDGSYWALYGQQSGGMLYVTGFVQGSGTSSNGTFTSGNARDFGFQPSVAGTVTASYVPGTSIAGTVAATGVGSVNFSGTTAAIAPYTYNQPASLAGVAGNWSLSLLSGETAAITVSDSGAFAGVSSLGCQFSGSLVPRASGKNVFNVNLTFGSSPCALPNQVGNGIAVHTAVSTGASQLIVLVTDSSRTYGTGAFGAR